MSNTSSDDGCNELFFPLDRVVAKNSSRVYQQEKKGKSMLKKLGLLCTILLAGCTGKQESKPSYQFVIMSNHGEIKKESDGSYKLILDHGNIEKVLAFSGKDHRLAKIITGEDLNRLWTKGSNSFAEDPPNATVMINDQVQAVVLLNEKVESSQTIFTIRADKQHSLVEASGKTQLFVDGECLSCTNWFY